MDGEASYVVAQELDLASVNPGANRDAEVGDRGTNLPGASNCSGGTIEHGEKSIPGSLNLAPSKAVEGEPNLTIMLKEQLSPGGIAEPLEMRG